MIPYDTITITNISTIYKTTMTVMDDAYLIEETHIPEGGLPGVRVSVQENINGSPAWIECDAELTEWVWHLYNDFQAADSPSAMNEIPF